MQLIAPRLRVILIATIWLIALAALVLWLGSSRLQRVAIAGGPAGSETLALTEAIASVLNEKDLGFRLIVFETGGSQQNLQLLEKGRVEMAEIQGDTPASDTVMGVTTLYQDSYHLIASDDSGVSSFADLGERRVAIPSASSGQFNSFWFLARHFGVADELPRALPMSEDAANFAMELGQVDAVFRVRAPGNDAIRELIGDRNLQLIPIEQAQALALKQPAIAPGLIPRGSYRGSPALPQQNLDTAVVDRLLVARADLDEGLVYRITRAIYENRSEILDHSLLAGFIGPLPDDSDSVITAHPGARSYFDREKPGIMQRNARSVSAMLYMMAIIFSALLALRTHWVRSRRMRMHDFNRRLMELSSLARTDSRVDTLHKHKHELMDILEEVVGDLERERVSQDEFEHFSFTWQAVDALVRDRLLLASGIVTGSVEEKS
ncbi:MAG: TAXI family TRAP transporter solute-binding subunit [Halioglobus sp.]|nr:TAXI family TRAP transporter solute-binding subunit [Halioglobus sp.]